MNIAGKIIFAISERTVVMARSLCRQSMAIDLPDGSISACRPGQRCRLSALINLIDDIGNPAFNAVLA